MQSCIFEVTVVRIVLLFTIAALLSALPVQAACPDDPPAQPTASMQFLEVTPDLLAKFLVMYEFPEPDQTAELVYFTQDGGGANYITFQSDGSGEAIVQVPVSCLTPGTHTWTAYAIATCGGRSTTGTGSVSLPFDSIPTVSIQGYVGPDANGNGKAVINYEFKNVFADSLAVLWLQIDGVDAGRGPSQPRKGTWEPELARGCWSTLTANILACGQYFATHTLSLPPPKPTVDLSVVKLGKDPATGNRIIMAQTSYDVKNAGAQVRIELLKWVEANGQVHPGGLLRQFTPGPTAGKDAFTFVAPSNARQLVLRAKVTGACEVVTDDAAVECAPCDNASENPVYYSDGNVKVDDGDPLPPVRQWSLARSYDSDEQTGGLFGRGWTTLFDRRVIVDNDTVLVTTESNEVVAFREVPGGFQQTWPSNQRGSGTLVYDAGAGTYTYRASGSTVETVFRASDGRVVTLRNRVAAGEAVIAYDALGQPATFTDTATAVTWRFTVDAQRHVTSIAVDGYPDLVWSYAYDGAGNLTAVTAPGNAAWRTYEYSDNYMTASRDALGNLIESHTYDADGFGISSTGDADEIASLQYNLPGSVPEERVTRITYKTGAQAEYALRPVGGAMRPVRVSGGCSNCGASEGTFVRDQHGRVVLHQDADGYITRTVYADDRVLSEERHLKLVGCDPDTDAQGCRLGTDALAVAGLEATSATETASYAYDDPLWPDRMTAVSRLSVRLPGQFRREHYTYHPVIGAKVSTTVTGWTGEPATAHDRSTHTVFYGDAPDSFAPAFDPGGSFLNAWLALPQPASLPKTVDGPRTDVQDVTSMVYYPVDVAVPPLLRGRLAATKNAAGHMTRYENYDVFGNATRIVDSNAVATERTFDALGRLVTSTTKGVAGCDTELDALCATDLTTTRAYTSGVGPLLLEQRPGGGVTSYTYDARGRMQTISRGPAANDLRERVETTYDALTGKKSLERMLAHENGAWVEKRRESFSYDSQARLQTVTHADGASIAYTYDRADRLAATRDENHTAPNTLYAYDPAGRLESVSQTLTAAPGGVIATRYTYDTNGNLTAVTDPNGNVTSYVYDDFGQMISQQSPVTGVTSSGYDSAGNLTRTTDANGATTVRTYDVLSRVLSACSSRTGSDTETVTWTYDDATLGRYGIGRLASMDDPTGTTLYRYERRGLLSGEENDGRFTSAAYTYDADGNRTTLGIAEYAFDFAGRPIAASVYGTTVVDSVQYLPFGPLTELTYGNGAMKTMEYDARYLPTRNKLTLSSTVIADYAYQHDATGNITQIHDAVDAAYNRDFTYDDLNRLVTANTGPALWGNGSYAYDAMGNMTSLSLGTAQSVAFSYAGTTPNLSSVNGVAVTYDNAGNEAANISARNLVAFEPETAHYVYDGRGVRVKEWLGLFETSTPFSRTFQYSPELRLLGYTNTLLNQTWSSSITWLDALPVGQLSTSLNGMPLGEPQSTFAYTFTDHLGTPLLQMDGADVVWRAEYEPYGSIYEMRAGNAEDQRLRFPGQEGQSNGDERYYNIFRWYRSGWGRYSSADPLLSSAMDFTHFPIETNPVTQPYSYAAGNPIQYVDPLGLYVAPGPVIDACVKTKNPYIIGGGIIVAVLIVATNNYPEAQPGNPKPYKGPCNECKDDDDDDDCDAQLADEQARCFNWWGGLKKNHSKLKACNQSAMWRWFECKKNGVPHTPLSPTPFQY